MGISVYDHINKYWDCIDRASLNAFIMVTEKNHEEDIKLLKDIEEFNFDGKQELINDIKMRQEIREKVQDRLKE